MLDYKLPIGVRRDEQVLEDFELSPVGEVTEAIVADAQFQNNHLMQWLGRLVSSFTESVGGEPVYERFEKSKFKKIPKVILDMPLNDVSYLVVAGHMRGHGSELELENVKCPSCGKKIRKIDVDLDTVKHIECPYPDVWSFLVDLPIGYKHVSQDKDAHQPWWDHTWNRVLLRPATLREAIKAEPFLTQRNKLGYHMRVIANAIVGIERTQEDENGDLVKVDELPSSTVDMLRYSIFGKLETRDRKVIRRATNLLPGIELEVNSECPMCGDDIWLPVGITDFFPMA